MRIQRLVEKEGVDRESATITVYARDADRGIFLTSAEMLDWKNCVKKFYPNWSK